MGRKSESARRAGLAPPKVVKKVELYIKEVIGEMRKVTWTSRRALLIATLLVIALSAILSLFVGFWDLLFSHLLHILIR